MIPKKLLLVLMLFTLMFGPAWARRKKLNIAEKFSKASRWTHDMKFICLLLGLICWLISLQSLNVVSSLPGEWGTNETSWTSGLLHALFASWERGWSYWWGHGSPQFNCVPSSRESDACSKCYNAALTWCLRAPHWGFARLFRNEVACTL